MIIITDYIGAVVARMRATVVDPKAKQAGEPYYMFGSRREIDNRVIEKNEDKVFKYQKYPLIALVVSPPPPVLVTGDVSQFLLNILILASTNKGYNAQERMENVFKPVLYPLYEDFLLKLKRSGLFMWEGNQYRPSHTQFDRYQYGTQSSEGTTQNIFTDPLDAIEMVNLKLRVVDRGDCPRVFSV